MSLSNFGMSKAFQISRNLYLDEKFSSQQHIVDLHNNSDHQSDNFIFHYTFAITALLRTLSLLLLVLAYNMVYYVGEVLSKH